MTAPKSLYFIALVPTGELLDELWEMKRQVSGKYNTRQALKSPPHVTLYMPFQYRDDREKALIQSIGEVTFEPVLLELLNFNSFTPRVIYVDVVQHTGLMELQKRVEGKMRSLLPQKDATYENRGFTPHLTLAFRDLRKSEFFKAWEEYKDLRYHAKQLVDHFCLLKHNGKHWEVFREFPLRK